MSETFFFGLEGITRENKKQMGVKLPNYILLFLRFKGFLHPSA